MSRDNSAAQRQDLKGELSRLRKGRPVFGRPELLDSERLKVSVRDPERHVALKRVLGRHFYRAGGRP